MAGLISGCVLLFAFIGSVFAQENATIIVFPDDDNATIPFNTTTTTSVPLNTTTTTMVPITTTVAPIKPQIGHWNKSYTNSNQTCMMLEAAIQLKITYLTKNNTYNTVTVNVPADAAINDLISQCDNSSEINETMAVYVPQFSPSSFLQFYFTRDPRITGASHGDKAQMFKIRLTYYYNEMVFRDLNSSLIGQSVTAETNTTLHEFAVLTDRSFKCVSAETMKLGENVKIIFTDVRAEAFMKKDSFSTADVCSMDAETSDIIPIAIGATLAAIVLIVLVVYLVGRARARRTTYESI